MAQREPLIYEAYCPDENAVTSHIKGSCLRCLDLNEKAPTPPVQRKTFWRHPADTNPVRQAS
jgi:hypothetical protein